MSLSRFAKLALAATVTSVVLITVGALVRGTSSGLGCPDWPKCHGSWIPPLQFHALIEYSHRLMASVVGLLVLIVAILAWARFRSQAGIFWPSFAALVVVVFQGGLGRLVVERELEARLVVLHFATSLALLGLLVLATVNSAFPRGGRMTRLTRESFLVAAGALSVALLGAYVVQTNASLAFPDWPLMGGRLLPPFDRPGELIHFLHRLAALGLGIGLVYLGVRVTRAGRDRPLVILAHSALALWAAQVAVGAANVFSRTAAWAVVAHVLGGAALWGTTLALSVVSYRRASIEESAGPAPSRTPSGRGKVKAYFLLTKPRVVELLLITTVPAMVVAAEGWPPLFLLLATLIGGSLAAGGAGAINCYLERDLDGRMERTSSRPIPRGEIEPRAALTFGIVLGAVSFACLSLLVNLLAAALALSALLFYVFVYTILLKRNTPSNIVIGGAAGAAPVLVGWAAVTGKVQIPALVMFAIIFYWTPPHFWALSLRYWADYEAAGVPMLPVVQGAARTTRKILLYTLGLVGVSLLLYPAGRMGILYLATALGLGAMFVVEAMRLRRDPTARRAMSLFRFSILYLTLLFAAIALDRLVEVSAGSPLGAAVLRDAPWMQAGWLSRPVFIAGALLFLAFEAVIFLEILRGRRARVPSHAWD